MRTWYAHELSSSCRVIQFSAPALGGFLPPPETGEGWGGGEEFGSQPPGPLPPPIPAFPRAGGKGLTPPSCTGKSEN
jgi:hypothetical protein